MEFQVNCQENTREKIYKISYLKLALIPTQNIDPKLQNFTQKKQVFCK
ncbi:MAG: hypothetical protein ACI8PD_002371 [Nitrospinales bacterium]|jgi:hypothetical protein